jgi:DNA-binding IclR family transcriptional regulator
MLTGSCIRSVDRAAAILLALGESPGELGVVELAQAVQLHKSTVSRLLTTLRGTSLVEQDADSGKYRLGLAMIRLGDWAQRSVDTRGLAQPELELLSRSCHETSSLGVIRGQCLLVVAYCDPSARTRDRTGLALPLHATAAGKMLLAFEPERNVLRLARSGFISCTPRTLVSTTELLEELAHIRHRGYATAFAECEPNVNSVAVPVFDQRSKVTAALELSARGNRITMGRLPSLLELARRSAAVITVSLGGIPPGAAETAFTVEGHTWRRE